MQMKHTDKIEYALKSWLFNPDLSGLSVAVRRTVEENYFHSDDIQFAINHLKVVVDRGDFRIWVEKNRVESKSQLSDDKVLCLHAGNLPMVGLQDTIAVLLSGLVYGGKISRKDPHLIPSFLMHLINQFPEFESRIKTSTELNDFRDFGAHYWLFAGDESSLNEIKSILLTKNITHSNAESLQRVAHFSIAILPKIVIPSSLQDLVESILRYDGKGCRSVAIVYSDSSLLEVSSELNLIGKRWLNRSRRQFDPQSTLKWKYAYNAAIGINQVWVGNALLQEGIPVIGHNQHIFWQPLDKMADHISLFGKGIQQVYSVELGNTLSPELFQNRFDYLRNSQAPSLYWTPDGVDPLEWILTR
jgi:hypothetical protein